MKMSYSEYFEQCLQNCSTEEISVYLFYYVWKSHNGVPESKLIEKFKGHAKQAIKWLTDSRCLSVHASSTAKNTIHFYPTGPHDRLLSYIFEHGICEITNMDVKTLLSMASIMNNEHWFEDNEVRIHEDQVYQKISERMAYFAKEQTKAL